MIIDSSALLAILLDEAERRRFVTLVAMAQRPRMSAASYVEVGLRLDALHRNLDPALDAIVAELGITVVAFDLEQGRIAREASVRFGRSHPAKLNFGDSLTYALARSCGEPLLFKGNNFGLTDLLLAGADPDED